MYQKKMIYGTPQQHRNYHKSFFHPAKDRYIGNSDALIDQFAAESGNYQIPGVEWKLNLLLYGPPGTGKSKLIRTLAMHLQRSVVSFKMSQVETESQIMTLLEDLSSMQSDADYGEPYRWSDLIFCIEEIDTDKKKVCWQRELIEANAKETAPAADETPAAEKEAEEETGKKKGKWKPKHSQQKDKLSLGTLLTILDGGCPTPGRLIVMTTNQEDKLDRALVRPGRMKKILMDNLNFGTFKQMVMHFRPNQRNLPIRQLWTAAIDDLGQQLMDDFQRLGEKRTSHLDKRDLGLSPALLQELCL
eukprot:SAG31_NODE_8425_length_1455_cov_1.162242_2_plen_302_part_01